MDTRIRLLESDVVDQIAAGEVVERPSHLVKELVENAIDAGATVVDVEYDQGGRRIRVTDNGFGIPKDDLALALARHATSKIKSADDLWSLGSFGFRGEALASIAAVSHLTLQSRTAGAETAHRIVSEFGRLKSVEPASGNPGTTVLVEDLFANIPARLKFLKSEAGENAQIKNTLKALALAHENVEFRIRSKGKVESLWKPAENFVERVRSVTEHRKLFHVAGEYQDGKAEIVFASPHDITGNTRSISIFVQGRWVQDRSLQAAVIEAYRGLLMHGEYPICVVRLKVPPSEVDVNIHPTKSQVKFRDPQTAFRAVNRTLRSGLETAPWLVRAETAAETVTDMPSRKLSVADLTRPYTTSAARTATETEPGSLATAPEFSVGRFEGPEFSAVMFKQKSDYSIQTETPNWTETSNRTGAGVVAVTDTSAATDAVPPKGPWSRLQILSQANLTYIVAQAHDRLVLIDQHAAHERVAYEKLMNAWLGGGAEVQPLLVPLTVELEPDGAEALVSVSGDLEKLGVSIDQNGPQSIAIRALPVRIKEKALVKALKELASEINDRGGSFALENKISDLCATMACHSVVRAGQALSLDQMKSLLEQMDEFALSSFCPHGRPVSVDYPFAKLERDFGRIV